MRRAFLCLKKGVLCTRLSSVAQRAFSRLTSLDPAPTNLRIIRHQDANNSISGVPLRMTAKPHNHSLPPTSTVY